MNIELKFRGKSISKNKWEYGNGVFKYRNKIYIVYTSAKFDRITRQALGIEIQPETLGIWTGVHDKNDKEIYTGDICKDDEGFLLIVDFDGFEYILKHKLYDYRSWEVLKSGEEKFDWYFEEIPFKDNFAGLEIVGNIFDSPEIIKNY